MTPAGLAAKTCPSPGGVTAQGVGADSTAVIGGQLVPCTKITGLIIRLSYIAEREIRHVAAEDYEDVLAEMGAFLTVWLTSLACPVLNRPSGGCLSGAEPATRAMASRGGRRRNGSPNRRRAGALPQTRNPSERCGAAATPRQLAGRAVPSQSWVRNALPSRSQFNCSDASVGDGCRSGSAGSLVQRQ